MATTAEKQAERPAGIESTAKRVLGPLSWLTHVLKRIPYAGYKTALRFEDALYQMTHGPDLLEWWSDELALGVQVEGLEHLPASGPVILYANHPTGLTDGIALWDAIKAIRPDVKIMMNAQGLDVIPAFRDLLVPVRLGKNGTSTDVRGTWNRLTAAMDQGHVMFMFPAGRLSQLDWFGDWDVHEQPWRKGIVKMARDYPNVTMLPVFIEGRVRKHFYVLHRLFPFLRDVLLYTEFHSKRFWPYRVRLLSPVPVTNAREVQAYVEGHKRRKWFQLPRQKSTQ